MSSPKVLLVEDAPLNRKVMVKMLTHLGYDAPDEALNGQEALEDVRENDYDIILMDVQMPVMNGLDATRAILSTSGENPPIIVAVTAHALESHRQECMEAGMQLYISKPIELATLRETMEQAMALLGSDD